MNHSMMTAIAVSAGLLAGGAFAKAHGQGNTEVPGENVGAETVYNPGPAGSAQELGELKGMRPADKSPVGAGKSSSAGR